MSERYEREPDEPLEHVLFLAVTRPALFLGMPMEAAAFCLMGGQLMALAMGSMIYMPLGAGSFGLISAALSRYDPLIFRVLLSWGNSRPQNPDLGRAARRWWGGLSMSPLRPVCHYKPSELGRNV